MTLNRDASVIGRKPESKPCWDGHRQKHELDRHKI